MNEFPEEFEKAWQELLEAEECQPCDGEECEYRLFCRYIRSYGE